jgi:hypothetical protein
VWEILDNIEPSLGNNSPTCQRQWRKCWKRQTRPLVREGAPHQQHRNCLTNKNLVFSPRWGLTPRLTGRLTVDRKVTLINCCWPSPAQSFLLPSRNKETLCSRGPAVISSQPVPSSKRGQFLNTWMSENWTKILVMNFKDTWSQQWLCWRGKQLPDRPNYRYLSLPWTDLIGKGRVNLWSTSAGPGRKTLRTPALAE